MRLCKKKIVILIVVATILFTNISAFAGPPFDNPDRKTDSEDEAQRLKKEAQEAGKDVIIEERYVTEQQTGDPVIVGVEGNTQEDPPQTTQKTQESQKTDQKTKKGNEDKSKDSNTKKDTDSTTKPGDSVPGGKDVLPEKDIAWKNKVIGTTKVNSKFENVIGGPGGSVQMIPIPLKWTKEIMDEGWKDDDETILNAKYFKELGWVIEGDPEKTYYIDVKMSETFIDTSSVNTKYWEWNLGKAHQNGKNKIKQNTLDIKNMWAIFPAPGEYIVTATPYETYDIGSIYTQYKVYQTKETKYEYVKKTRKVPKTVYEYDWDDYIPSNYYRGQLPVKKKTIYVTETYYEKVPKDKYYVHIDFVKNHFIKKTETSPPKPNEKRKVTIKIIVPAQEVGKKIYFLWFINGPIEVNTDTHISK